jgi:hypothetical protein
LVPASNHTVDAKDTRPYAEWESVLDAASGNVYYYSPLTRTTTWDKPVGYRDELIVTRGTSAEREGWKTVSVSGSWSKADGTAGGCYPNCRTWRNNPQIMFSLAKTNRSCDALVQIEWIFGPNDPAPVVSATGKKKKRKHPPIGVYVVKNEGPFFQKLFVDKTDIAARSNFKKSGAVSCELNISTPASKGKLLLYYMRADSKTKQGLSFPKHFTIIPCTFNEGVEGKFKITLHTKNESYMRMLTDQHRLLDIPQRTRAYQSQWLGPSAGGCRNHATFTNNTRFELNTNTNGTFVGLLQQSSSSEMLTIGMYVMDREGTVVRKAAFMQAPEASCVFDYDATKAPFYLVPCTFDPGFEAEFTLTLIWKDPQLDVTFNPCV